MGNSSKCHFCGSSKATRSYYKCGKCGRIICDHCMNKLKTHRTRHEVCRGTGRIHEYGWDICPSCEGVLAKIASASSDGGCFITSATLQSMNNNDDNCYELTTFRKFRDTWLKENHPEDIIRYYLIAPKIVEAIDAKEDSKVIYESIWRTHLQKCLMLIENEENESAYGEYKSMVEELEKLY